MGNKDFLQLIRSSRSKLNDDYFSGKRVAVDLYSVLHKAIQTNKNYRHYVVQGQDQAIIADVCRLVTALAVSCTSVLIVADGNNLPGKQAVNDQRASKAALEEKFQALRTLLEKNKYIFNWKSLVMKVSVK